MEQAADLQRFVEAQDRGGTYETAVRELRSGRKESHWMWFVFPQVASLGRSATAQHFALAGLDEAVAYLAHPVLGPRLRECTQVLADLDETGPVAVFGSTDALKLRSSLTLFAHADEDATTFRQVLEQYFGGEEDEETLRRL